MPRQDYDKIVKLACKPKNAPPKAKYLDALIAASFDENTLNDITRALSLRLKDGNPIVVFKALLTLHQMMRSGSAETLLAFLSRSDVLRLRNVKAGTEGSGYHPPSNLSMYAYYLDTRIRAFRDLRHDLVYLQTESNRRSNGQGASAKARRLRHLPVSKGLLREVKQVQRILDDLIRCTFYDDDLRDENTILAFRMLIKDLLVLFQAGNEGVCNILEHYFEMSKSDATEAFDIYKSFIKQTDKIVDYLAYARRLSNIINVPVPSLKHAPTSLVKALEEYLHDPNFEQNRLDYKNSLAVAEGKPVAKSNGDKSEQTAAKSTTATPSASTSTPAPPAPVANAQQKIQDFLDSIESEQAMTTNPPSNTMGSMNNMGNHMPMMIGGSLPQMGGMNGMNMGVQPNQFGQMGQVGQFGQMPLQMNMTGPNPFRASMLPQQTGFMGPQMTGFPGQQQPFQQPQQTGFLQPQATGQMAFGHPQRSSTMPMESLLPSQSSQQSPAFAQHQSQPFAQQQQQQQQQHQQPFGNMQSQPTGFLQPQTTGSNPFRASTMGPLATGMSAFSQPASPFQHSPTDNRPGSAPNGTGSGTPTKLTAQKTGSNNPFAPPGGVPAPAPPVPKQPTMNDLAQQRWQQQFAAAGGLNPQQQQQQQQQSQQQPAQKSNVFSFDPLENQDGTGTGMSDIASAFATDKPQQSQSQSQSQPQSQSNDFFSQFSSLSMGTSPAPAASSPGGFLQPQRTGYGGSAVKPFKPTSNFGSSLMETLPPLPESGGGAGSVHQQSSGQGFPFNEGGSGGGTPTGPFGSSTSANGAFGQFSQSTGNSNSTGPSQLNAQKTGFQPTSNFGQQLAANPTGFGMQPQTTGNPFRQSSVSGPSGGFGNANGNGNGAFGATSPFAGQNGQNQNYQIQRQQSLF